MKMAHLLQMRQLIFLIHRFLYRLKQLEADLVFYILGVGDDGVLISVEPDLDRAVALARGGYAERREKHAPPILPLALTDKHAEREIFPRGKASTLVIFRRVFLFAKGRNIPPLRPPSLRFPAKAADFR